MKVSRRNFVRIISFTLAGIVLLAAAWAVSLNENAKLRREISADREHAFYNLADGLSAIDAALTKQTYAKSPGMTASLSGEVSRRASSALAALGQLPYAFAELEGTAKYLTELGDFSSYIAKKSAGSGELGEEDRKQIEAMAGVARNLAARMSALRDDMNSGGGNAEELKALINAEAKSVPSDGESSIEGEFPEIPALIYDGPFSGHIERKTPMYLEDKPEVSAAEALDRAAAFLGVSRELLEVDGEGQGKIPAYHLSAKLDGGEVSMEITKKGGAVLGMLSSRTVREARLSPGQCVEAAKAFLEEQGYKGMRETYWIIDNNAVMINFAYEQDGVICYPDLIIVSVAQDDGKITGFESRGFIMNHTPRDIARPKISGEKAKELVDRELYAESHRLAIIPTPGGNELLCHEFKCSAKDGRGIIVYINAATGQEEKILILLESENGTLTL